MGCAPTVHTLYHGPKLPKDQVAILSVWSPPLYIMRLDEYKDFKRTAPFSQEHDFELLPGVHTITIKEDIGGGGGEAITLSFTVEPGLEYYIEWEDKFEYVTQDILRDVDVIHGTRKFWVKRRNPDYITVYPRRLVLTSSHSPKGVVSLRHKDGKVINLVSTKITGCEDNRIEIKSISKRNGEELEVTVHVLENQSKSCRGYLNIEVRTVDFPRNRFITIPFFYVRKN